MHEEAEASSRVEACACRNLSLGRGKFLTYRLFLFIPAFLEWAHKKSRRRCLKCMISFIIRVLGGTT